MNVLASGRVCTRCFERGQQQQQIASTSPFFRQRLPCRQQHFSDQRRLLTVPASCFAACRAQKRVIQVMASDTHDRPASDDKIRVLFVCLGNICRSPSAEAVFRAVVEREGLADRFEIDSCGTGGGNPEWYFTEDPRRGWSYHEGDQADPRMRQAAERRQVFLTSRSRPLTPQDLSSFDYLIGMDAKNVADIQVAADHWAAKHEVPSNYRDKIKKMTSYLRADKFKRYDEVPDPYFAAPGDQSGFDLVLDLLDDACEGFLEALNLKSRC